MKRFLLTDAAVRDIDGIRVYLLEQGGTRLVRHVMIPMRQTMEQLGRTPFLGHFRNDLTDAPARCRQVFSWLIVYDPTPRPIHIVRVLHSSRDVEAVLVRSGVR